jgi:hypothetical protein
MKKITIKKIQLISIVAAFLLLPFKSTYAQEHWITLPDGKHMSVNKNEPVTISSTKENGNLKSLQTEDPKEVIKIIVTLKEKPLALYKEKSVLRKVSLINVKSTLQELHSSVKSKINRIAQQLSARSNFQYQYTVRREYYTSLNGMALECNRGMMEYIRSLPEVKNVQLDRQVKADLTQSVHQIRADIVQDSLGYNGDGVLVGSIDTGIDYNNPALGGGSGPQFRVIGGHDFANNDNDPMDDNGHGTHVAGIIGANGGKYLRGVAPHVKFLAVKVLDKDGSGLISDIIAGIEYCMDPDGNPATDDAVDVINMSLGGSPANNDPLELAVDNATQAGILSVVAAGNQGEPIPVNTFGGYTTISSPGTAVTALTVGACDSTYWKATFSSNGPDRIHFAIKPEVVAPGVGILSTVLNNGTASLSGTSMATPHVTGVAALLKQQHKDWSPEQLKSVIVNSAKPLDAIFSPYDQGNGCVDALNAATLGVSVQPGVINFGLVDLSVNVWKDTVKFIVRNLRKTSQNMNLEIQRSDLPAGVELNLSQTSFTLGSMQETTVIATIAVPSSVPKLEYTPYAYTGNIICRSDSDRVQIPFGVSKINTLVIECDRLASGLMLYTQNSVIDIFDSYGYDYKYIIPMDGGTYGLLFAELLASDEFRSRDTFYIITRKNINTKGYNHISLNHTEAVFSPFNDLDKVRDISGNPVSGLDTCRVHLAIAFPALNMVWGLAGIWSAQSAQWFFAPIDSSAIIIQDLFSVRGKEALLLKTMSSGIKAQSDLTFLSGPKNLGYLNLKFKYNSSPTSKAYIQTDVTKYLNSYLDNWVLSDGYFLPNLQDIHFMTNRNPGVFDPLKYYSMSACIGTFNQKDIEYNIINTAPSWKLSTSDFIADANGDFQFLERKPFRPDLSEYIHIQTLPSGDTVSVEDGVYSPIVQFPKFQFFYKLNTSTGLSVSQFNPDYYDDGSIINSNGIHAQFLPDPNVYPSSPLSRRQFAAQMFTKNNLLQGTSYSYNDCPVYYDYKVNINANRYRLLAETYPYNFLGQSALTTIDYEFNIKSVTSLHYPLPSLDFFQILGDGKPVGWLHPDQDGKVRLVIFDPKQNIDSVGIYLLKNDGTEIGLVTTHPSAKEYFASIPKNIQDDYYDIIARVHDTESNTFELIASPAFYYGTNKDIIPYDARLRLSTYTLDNLNSVHFNTGDTLKYTLTYTIYGNFSAKDVSVHFPQTDYFAPVGNSIITLDSIRLGRRQNSFTIPLTLVFLGKKQPGDMLSYYTPSISWNSSGRLFSRKHKILVDLSDVPTTLAENGNAVPKEFTLSQNYPNPFNPTTVIGYQLPIAGHVKLSIYNLLGQKIKTLINSFQNAGKYSVIWNATDNSSNQVSSGIYFYKMETNGMSFQKKMLMIK